jgi:hypothetical protein
LDQVQNATLNINYNKKIKNFISGWLFKFTIRAGNIDEFSLCERMFVRQLRLAGKSLKKIRESAMAFMDDLTRPILQISPGTFLESLESCSQLTLTDTQTSSQRGKLTLFPSPHGEGEGIILYKIS